MPGNADPGPVIETTNLWIEDNKALDIRLDQEISSMRQALKQMPRSDPEQFVSIDNLAEHLLTRYNDRGHQDDLKEAISLRRDAVELAPQSHPKRPSTLNNLAYALSIRADRAGLLPDLDEVVSLRREAVELTIPGHYTLPILLNNLGLGLLTRFERRGDINDLDDAIKSHQEAIGLVSNSPEDEAWSISNLANVLLARFEYSGNDSDIQKSVATYRKAISLLPPEHPDHSTCFRELGYALLTRFKSAGDQMDLIEAVGLYRKALQLVSQPGSGSDPSQCLDELGYALTFCFQHGGDKLIIDEAVMLHRHALKLRPRPHPERTHTLNNLAAALASQFENRGDRNCLAEAIKLREEALELVPHPHPGRFLSLGNLATVLKINFEDGGSRSDLDKAIMLHREALQLVPPPHPSRFQSLSNLAAVLEIRFKHGGETSYVVESIALHREALKLTVPDSHLERPQSLRNLATALKLQFEHGGDTEMISEAILLYKEALCLTPHPKIGRSSSLDGMAVALQARFKHEGNKMYLTEAISLHREAVQYTPDAHPDRSVFLENLAVALEVQFKHGSPISILIEAICLHKEVLKLRPHPHPKRSRSLRSLAIVFQARFKHEGDRADLAESVLLRREALELRPYPHPERVFCLDSLATALEIQFNHGGNKSDISESILLRREAIQLRPYPHPLRPWAFINLAGALETRSSDGQASQQDFDEINRLYREALRNISQADDEYDEDVFPVYSSMTVWTHTYFGGQRDMPAEVSRVNIDLDLDLVHDFHPERANWITSLVELLVKFQRTSDVQTLREAITLCQQPIKLQSSADPHFRFHLSHALGNLHMKLYKMAEENNTSLNNAISAFSSAVKYTSISPFDRFRTAQRWAVCANLHRHPSAMEAYSTAMHILPQITLLSHDLQLRQEILANHSNISVFARHAAKFAISMQQIDKAIEHLEAGRAIIWSQILQLRSPLGQLIETSPELGAKLHSLAKKLEQVSHVTLAFPRNVQSEQEASQITNLTIEWSEKLNEVRRLPGFEDFLRPRRISSLQKAASTCPIVILLPANEGSYCLILTPERTHHMSIPTLTNKVLKSLVTKLELATSKKASRFEDPMDISGTFSLIKGSSQDRLQSHRVSTSPTTSNSLFQIILEVLWKEVVHPVITLLIGVKKPNPRRKLQWCPTGLFTFLPIHAAGVYSVESGLNPGECAFDYIISSYIPTIGALLDHDGDQTVEEFKIIVVVDKDLPAAHKELENIKKRAPSTNETNFVELGVGYGPAQVDEVISHLSTASIVHFACHGLQDKVKPLNSALYLGREAPLMISKIMEQPLPYGSIAFLCACQTAMGDRKLPDESMSIGATLLFSGFRSVIATMWEIKDHDGPIIADTFYEELFRGLEGDSLPKPDVTRSALSLDVAVQKLRLSGVPFRDWVPFIHIGK